MTINVSLINAIRSSDLVEMQSLLSRGADVNALTSGGATPLHLAAEIGDPEVVELLLKAGADANARDGLENTPLYYAQVNSRRAAASLLRKARASCSTRAFGG